MKPLVKNNCKECGGITKVTKVHDTNYYAAGIATMLCIVAFLVLERVKFH